MFKMFAKFFYIYKMLNFYKRQVTHKTRKGKKHAVKGFLLSLLAGKRDIVVTILVRCMCVRQCVRPDLSGP